MKIGMLWFDDDKRRSLEQKIRQAAEYYEGKYGAAPNVCFVNNKTLQEELKFGQVKVFPINKILPHHFWLGVHSSNTGNGAEVKSS